MHLLFFRPIPPPPYPYTLLRFSRLFSALRKMNPSGGNDERSSLAASDLPLPEQDYSAAIHNRNSGITISQETTNLSRDLESWPKQSKSLSNSNPPFTEEWPPISAARNTFCKHKSKGTPRTRVELPMDRADEGSSLTDSPASQHDESCLPTHFGKKGHRPSRVWRQRVDRGNQKNQSARSNPYPAKEITAAEPFDICLLQSTNSPPTEDPLHPDGIDVGEELEHPLEIDEFLRADTLVLRPGMVLLRNYLSCSKQIEIVRKCRDLGVEAGGFYQPGYKDGAKLRLQMMCLGSCWDPQKRAYLSRRTADGCTPPGIPPEFLQLVQEAIHDSHALITYALVKDEEAMEIFNVEEILPGMTPDICIVNFYATTGRLGLHQDRDESEESLRKGLPVVSFSLGDSAEFLYGDERDTEKADKIILKSGDVLIFGGKSRHIFHGVTAIIPDSAPAFLLKGSNLRPGRLNLTFRQY